MQEYKTPAGRSTAELTFKKSRFIATVVPVCTEQQAADFFSEIKRTYRDARHNVTAFLLKNGNLARYSDDGEPHSTAGLPVFQAIGHFGLTNCAVTVTRYFGGVLLGTGGLVRAYFETACAGIAAGKILTMKPATVLTGQCSYADYAVLEPFLHRPGVQPIGADFAEQVHLRLVLQNSALADFLNLMTETFAGRLHFTEQEKIFYGF